MAASYTGLISEAQISARLPLLMDHNISSSNTDHTVNIDSNGRYESDLSALPSSSSQTEHVSLDLLAIDDQRLPMGPPPPPPPPPAGRMDSFGRHSTEGSNYRTRQRTSPLNSGLWVLIELIVTVSQIVASAIVLSLSRGEKPQAPLSVWVLGYATGCLVTLPLLYWRYKHCNGQPQRERDSLTLSSSSSSSISPRATHVPILAHNVDTQPGASSGTVIGNSRRRELRVGLFVERFKIALDCFFAVWFVVGNVWVFGGHSSSSEAPNLYRLCIVFLTFSCIGYAMPFILCATICCCLPCITRILGTNEDEGQARGAPAETIEGLPKCKFKALAKSSKGSKKGKKEEKGIDIEAPGEGGFVFAGMEKERPVSADDAVCCICLGKYKDGAELRELPCTHFFHVECVDKWLKINACCPLCKNEIGTSVDQTTQGSR